MAIISIPSSIGGVSIPGAAINGPLGALFGNKYNVDTLKYPRDLESSTRGHVVKFNIYEVTPVGYQDNKQYSISDTANGLTNLAGKIGSSALNTVTSAASSAASSVGSALSSIGFSSFGDKVSSLGNTGKSGDAQKSVSLTLNPSTKRITSSISLYMPDALSFDYEQNWSETNISDIAKDALTGAMANLPGKAGGALGKLVTGTIESGAGKLLLKSQGLAVNPNQQVLFDGIPLRNYSMAFTFTPYSKQENVTVQKIIKTFKTHARPRTVTGSGGMLFIPPSVFQLEFLFNGKTNPNVSKVTESVITGLSVNYTPSGFSTHTDGAPVQIQLNIQFKELKLVDRDGEFGISRGY